MLDATYNYSIILVYVKYTKIQYIPFDGQI